MEKRLVVFKYTIKSIANSAINTKVGIVSSGLIPCHLRSPEAEYQAVSCLGIASQSVDFQFAVMSMCILRIFKLHECNFK